MSYGINFFGGRKQSPNTTIFVQTADGTVTNDTAELPLTSSGEGSLVLPANFFKAGRSLHIYGKGIHSSSGGGTLTLKIKLGSTVILTTGAIASGNDTDAQFDIDALLTCRTMGASGTVAAAGHYEEDGGSPSTFEMVNLSPVTLNTTISQTLSITAQWSTASVNKVLSLQTLFIEAKNPS
jgi:hypothetical protein